VSEDAAAPRTADRYLFRLSDWPEWVRPGVPGPRRRGWITPKGRAGRPRNPALVHPNPAHRPSALEALYREHALRIQEAIRS
jgi:hypothetical protein